MGTKNRQRRAAKAKRRARERTRDSSFTTAERVRGLLALVGSAARRSDEQIVARAIVTLSADDPRVVDRESEGALLGIIAMLWRNGWQPAEVIRQARRADARAGRLVAWAVAADHVNRDRQTLHPRWIAQLEALALPAVDGARSWIAVHAAREGLDRWTLVTTIVAAVRSLGGVGGLPIIIPPPGAPERRVTSMPDVAADDPVLVKVRALLAQAESTTFEAEADAFTAKAQELMARHAIDAAVLWSHSERDERPISIRIPIDDPYADIKSLLLQRVAKHSRCKAVHLGLYGLETVIGFASDVAATEMLFTSLLVQAHAALQREAAKAGPHSRARSRSFRSSFLMSFTCRIDERLAEINAAVETVAEAEHSEALLPVLAARGGVVDDEVTAIFGSLQSNTVRGGSDPAGWVRGRIAADQARLNLGDLDVA